MNDFRGWKIIRPFPARGAEADIFLAEKDGESRVLKLYRTGIQPKEEVLEKIALVVQESPEHFVQTPEKGVDTASKRFFEIQEFFPNGTLKNFLEKSIRMTHANLLDFVAQSFKALQLLHKHGILHLDLKPANILLRSFDPIGIAITDFGISSLIGEEFSKKLTDVKGTSLYQSPESLSGIVGPESDWWSLGMIVLEILAGRHPFEGMQRQAIYYKLTTSDISIPGDFPGPWQDLLRGFLSRDPEHRWSEDRIREWLDGNLAEKAPESLPDTETRSPLSHWISLAVPLLFSGKEYKTFEEILDAYSETPESWELSKKPIRDGVLVKWLEQNNDFERSEEVFRILGKGDHPDISLFRLLCKFRPDLPPRWEGEKMDLPFFERMLQRNSLIEPRDEGKRFLDLFFSGWIEKTIADGGGKPVSDSEPVFRYSESQKGTPLEHLALGKRCLVLLAAVKKVFRRNQPLQQVKRLLAGDKGIELIFRVACTEGFIPWANEQEILDPPGMVLWRFLKDCTKDGFSPLTAKMFEDLYGREEKLITAMVSKSGFQCDLTRFVCGGEITEEVFHFFMENRKDLRWMEEFFLDRFRVKSGPEFEKHCHRFSLILKMKKKADELKDRILPGVLQNALETGTKTIVVSQKLRSILASADLELLEGVIDDPSLLPKKGSCGVNDWGGMVGLLEKNLIPFPGDLDSTAMKAISTIVSDLGAIEKTSSESLFSKGIEERIAMTGMASCLILMFSGLGVLPAFLFFGLAVWSSEQERRSIIASCRVRIESAREKFRSSNAGNNKRNKG